MIFNIEKQKGVIVLTGAISSLSGNASEYTFAVSSSFTPGKYSIIAHKGNSETAICICNDKNKASQIIDNFGW